MNSNPANPSAGQLQSLADGNRFQRAYHRWATPHYARLDPELRAQAEALDLFLYTRAGLGAWLGWLAGLVGVVAGLWASGMGFWLALLVGGLGWSSVSVVVLGAWLMPNAALSLRGRRSIWRLVAGALGGGVLGFVLMTGYKRGSFDPLLLLGSLQRSLHILAPALLAFLLALLVLTWLVARVRQQALRREVERCRLVAERDAATLAASEAELRLLQAQIHPHFVFNTLAALQHWVDKGDARAAPLLRELTGFLRRSTEMLGRPLVPLGEELASVRHYLAIMKARWGERLRYELQLDPGLDAELLPPGLLLTLVENAVEHGLAPCLDGGCLRLHSERLASGWQLSVQDDGVGLPANWQEGVGLSNVRQRLAHHYGPRAQLHVTAAQPGCRAELKVTT